ncbi:AsnC family transcriptional regulator [Zobellella endophytica]|uniref:AsnC family transcriptional regulator n=1 Tax=Zobellella endophytica TaxID=2116700 RepID=A0A2P7R8D7_9GAMM|nr:AsnC family transcriptional regulator [Zobellella endophytica]
METEYGKVGTFCLQLVTLKFSFLRECCTGEGITVRKAHEIELDRQDARLLQALQENGRLSNVELSELIHLSPSQCQRRRQKLEELGVVQKYVAYVDPEKVGLHVTALISVTLGKHGERIADEFHLAIQHFPQVLECWSVTGDADYMLKVVATDLKSLSDFMMHQLLNLKTVSNIRSNILLDKLKHTTVLPLG